MNVVLDDAEEVYTEKAGKEIKARRDLGEFSPRHHSLPHRVTLSSCLCSAR